MDVAFAKKLYILLKRHWKLQNRKKNSLEFFESLTTTATLYTETNKTYSIRVWNRTTEKHVFVVIIKGKSWVPLGE